MKSKNQFQLLLQRRFVPFFWTQFLGALNDNVFKTALLTILTFDTLTWTTMDVGQLNQLIPGLFILPFLLFSASAGQIAEKVEKGKLARLVKLLEILIMCIAAYGWFWHQVWLLIAAIAGMGLHSTLFGPVKYAYLPQHLDNDELVGGNGLVEMGTFVGILLGQVIGAMLVVYKPWGIHAVAFGSIALAVLGFAISWQIPRSPAPVPNLVINWNPFTESIRNIRFSSQNRRKPSSLILRRLTISYAKKTVTSYFLAVIRMVIARHSCIRYRTLHSNNSETHRISTRPQPITKQKHDWILLNLSLG